MKLERFCRCGHSIMCHDGYTCDYPYDGWFCFANPVDCKCPMFKFSLFHSLLKMLGI